MKFFVCFLLLVSTLACAHSTSHDLDFIRERCVLVGSSSVLAYIGWPYEVKCDVVLGNLPYDDDNYYFDEESNTVCQVWNADGKLLKHFPRTYDYYDEGSHFVEDVTINGTNDFVVVENLTTEDGNHCFYAELNLTLIDFQQESCEEFVENYQREKPLPIFLNHRKTLNCEPQSSMLPSFAHSSDITYQFRKNCGETIKTGDRKLFFQSVQRSDAGDYVCSAIHNGMTRYLSMKSVCVAEKLKHVQPMIHCETQELSSKQGDTATFRCYITIGHRGNAQRSDVHVQWKKKTLITYCNSFSMTSNEHKRIDCSLGFKDKCSLDSNYSPIPNQPQINITFIIRNITQEDYGNYTFLVHRTPFNNSFVLTINPYVVDDLEWKKWSIVIAIIVVLILIGFAGFFIYQKLYIKACCKRHFPS